jgi:acetyltransferase
LEITHFRIARVLPMLRHALAPLFEPTSLLIVADRPLPVMAELPAALKARTTVLRCSPGEAPVIAEVESVRDQSVRDQANETVPPGAVAPDGSALREASSGAIKVAAGRPDLAVVCVAPGVLPETLRRLGVRAPLALILLPHEEADPYPQGTLAFCRDWARRHGCQLLGPRSFGVQRPNLGFNFSQHPTLARRGRVALVAQSRSILAAVMDWADDVHIGFSCAVSLGDEAVVGVAHTLDYLASDPRTDSIVLYLEHIDSARDFMSALRAAASVKPVIVLKAGRHAPDGADAVFDAALRRSGAVRVRYFVQLFSAVKALGYARRPRGRRVALLSNGNGPPHLALDMLGPDAPLERADLQPATARMLAGLLEPGALADNPVVTTAPFTAERMRSLLGALIDDPGVDGVLVLLAPDALADLAAVARELAAIVPAARKPVVTCFMGDAGMRPLRRLLDDAGTPAFRTPESAVDALGVLSSHFYNQQLLLQTLPPEAPGDAPDRDRARDLIEQVRVAGRRVLNAGQCTLLLDAFAVPIGELPGTLDESVSRPMTIRVSRDPTFGPVIRFGAGGADAGYSPIHRGLDLPPLNGFLARQMIERSRWYRRVLAPGLTSAAVEILLTALVRISTLVSELPDVETLTIDPILAGESHLYAGGMQIELTEIPAAVSPRVNGYPHMAIYPYPSRLQQLRHFESGEDWILRPIRPEDAWALQAFIRDLSEQSRYMRFVSVMRELTPRMLARYTQVDYNRELALVGVTQVPNPEHRGHAQECIIGFAHYLRNPDGRGAEYALVIGDAWQRRGLGRELMRALIDAAREQGLEYIDGIVLATNRPMLALMSHLGFTIERDPDDPTLRKVWLNLRSGLLSS